MGKFDGILICSDLDGTLLDSNLKISKDNLDAIEYFESCGGIFTYITGRVPAGLVPVFEMYTPRHPIGVANGAAIYDAAGKKYVRAHYLDPSVASLVEFAENQFDEIGTEVITENEIIFAKKNSIVEKHRTDELLPNIERKMSDVTEPLIKILFGVPEHLIPSLKSAFESHPLYNRFEFVRSTRNYYEILPKGSSKGAQLAELARLFGIKENRTVAIGDNDNDISMLKTAHIGYAVQNATEGAKGFAKRITASNDMSAIAAVICDIESGKVTI